jgi:DNA-binding NarL/FixJ family response regulator
LAQGLGTNEIAATLTISPSTVRNHVQNILGKLGVHSRLEAITYAYQHGMIEIGE